MGASGISGFLRVSSGGFGGFGVSGISGFFRVSLEFPGFGVLGAPAGFGKHGRTGTQHPIKGSSCLTPRQKQCVP